MGPVGDEERLYRRIRENVGRQFCFKVEGDRTVFTHAAFNDPGKQPSVDRARLKLFGNPHHTRLGAKDGIVTLLAKAVKALGPIPKLDHKRRPTGEEFRVNVTPDPLCGNCAHALIGLTPSTGGAIFTRFKEGLVRLANDAQWTVQPNSSIVWRRPTILLDALVCLVNRILRRL